MDSVKYWKLVLDSSPFSLDALGDLLSLATATPRLLHQLLIACSSSPSEINLWPLGALLPARGCTLPLMRAESAHGLPAVGCGKPAQPLARIYTSAALGAAKHCVGPLEITAQLDSFSCSPPFPPTESIPPIYPCTDTPLQPPLLGDPVSDTYLSEVPNRV